MSPAVRVVKVGGSLLDGVLDGGALGENLQRWLAEQSPAHDVLIVGGGRLTDVVREMDRRHSLGDEAAHGLALETMSITARLVANLLPGVPLVDDFAALRDGLADEGVTIFDARSFLADHEPHLDGTRLEASWDVTSDSIAARLAIVLGAAELVLLKSAPPPSGVKTIAELAEQGYVDRFSKRLASELPAWRVVNLQAEGCSQERRLHGTAEPSP